MKKIPLITFKGKKYDEASKRSSTTFENPGTSFHRDEVDGQNNSQKTFVPDAISKKFMKKTCILYERESAEKSNCKCGRDEHEHSTVPHDELDGISNAQSWSLQTHVKEAPTNAYGTVEFLGCWKKSQAKYIRVSDETDGKLAFDFLRKNWDIEEPRLLISVTGGAKNFKLEPKLKSLFQHGILKVALTSGAWVTTGGTNTGVMKHVGKALKSAGYGRNRVPCIGIATWGIIDHRQELVTRQGVDLVSYKVTNSMNSKGACLDNNHTHFFLVDNGTVGAYGKEINFRAKLEKEIMKCGKGVPGVLIVLQGGPNTVKTVYQSITSDPPLPVVIIKESGGAADLIALACDMLHGEGQLLDFGDTVEHSQLVKKVKETYPDQNEARLAEIYKNIVKVVQKKDYVTIFRIEEGLADLDQAILNAILKNENTSKRKQLRLAITWNRADVARTHIFSEEAKWEIEHLEEEMMKALEKNKADFVDLLREHGVDLDSFLNEQRLCRLYKAKDGLLKYIFDRKVAIGTSEIDKAIVSLLGDSMEGWYKNMFTSGSREKKKNAANALFIWAVMCNLKEMALCLWKAGDEFLAKALVACKMLHSMKLLGERKNVQEDLIVKLGDTLSEFQGIAMQLLDECAHSNEKSAAELLTYKLEKWGNSTCLSWAVAAEFEDFVAHGSCQALLTDLWDGAMSIKTYQSEKTLLAIIFPPLIFFLKFENKAVVDSMPTVDDESESEKNESTELEKRGSLEKDDSFDNIQNNGPQLENALSEDEEDKQFNWRRRPVLSKASTSQTDDQLSFWRKIKEFYKAPITKFWSNVLSYIVFLFLFAYVALVELPAKPSIAEWVLIVYVFTLTTEEIRQVLESDADNLAQRISDWGQSKWNVCDALAIFLFFLGVILRLVSETRNTGQIIYSLDLMFWVVRLLAIFSVNRHLGPYVVMIGRMTVDMMYFLFILAVFLLAYGIARKAILNPAKTGTWHLIGEVLFVPYFQVYGELFIEQEAAVGQTVFGTRKRNNYSGILVTLLMAFYLLVANILLLNLLIAIFNHTYDEVQAKATKIWKVQRYHLIMEYSTRPILVPPFIVINHVIMIVKWLRKSCHKKKEKRHAMKLKFEPKRKHLQKILEFEEECVGSYMRAKTSLYLAGQEEKIRLVMERVEKIGCKVSDVSKEGFSREKVFKTTNMRIENKLDRLTNIIEDILLKTDGSEVMVASSSVTNKQPMFQKPRSALGEHILPSLKQMDSKELQFVTNLKKPLSRADNLEVVRTISQEGKERKKNYKRMTSVNKVFPDSDSPPSSEIDESSKNKSPSHSCPDNSAINNDEEKSDVFPSKDPAVDVNGYFDSDQKPCSLKGMVHKKCRKSPYPCSKIHRFKVPDFAVDWETPFPNYAPETFTDTSVKSDDGTDPRNVPIDFNCIDGNINRKSNVGAYEVLDGWPRNPMGRTGLRGRGELPRWGPNHVNFYAITRWARDDKGAIDTLKNQPVLEFFAVRTSKAFALPSNPTDAPQNATLSLSPNLKEAFSKALGCDMGDQKATESTLQLCQEIYSGYLDDIRNTDNSWMEATVWNYHDNNMELKGGSEYPEEYSWREMTTNTPLKPSQRECISAVAEKKMAAFKVD